MLGNSPSVDPDALAHSIFSGDILDAIRKDIGAINLPSWMQKPPSNFGSASHGKLKADHWRTVCTVNMVITLVRLWGTPSATEDEKKALANFMHLVAAVDLASRRTMSAERARTFDTHMLEYIRGIRTLYNADLVPNHHLSLHLRDCLLLFGPTHSWWAFPFERYNGLLQRLNTNHRPGTCLRVREVLGLQRYSELIDMCTVLADMPCTFMTYFYIGAKLRWLMAAESWPADEEFQDMVASFQAAFQDAAQGTRVVDASAFTPHPEDMAPLKTRASGTDKQLDEALYERLLALVNSRFEHPFYDSLHDSEHGEHRPYLPSSAIFVSHATQGGVTFSTAESGVRNSFVLLQDPQHSGVVAGQIKRIFTHTRMEGTTTVMETYIVAQEYKTLSQSHQALDPFRAFPDVPTWLCYNEKHANEHLVRLDDVVSHFAAYVYTPLDIKKECIVVRSLDRVRLYYAPYPI